MFEISLSAFPSATTFVRASPMLQVKEYMSKFKNEIVVSDPEVLGDLASSAMALSKLFEAMDTCADECSDLHPAVAEAINASADLLQGIVCEKAGIDVRRVGDDEASGAGRIENAVDEILSLAARPAVDSEVLELRKSLQLVATGLNLHRSEVDSNGNSERASEILSDVTNAIGSACGNELPSEHAGDATPHRVMLVEDDQGERELLMKFLQSKGCSVSTFENGEQVLEYVWDHSPDAAMILDMNLPVCNGATVVRRIRSDEKFRSMKIIGVSASSIAENGVTLGANGVNSWLQKPFDPLEIMQVLESRA